MPEYRLSITGYGPTPTSMVVAVDEIPTARRLRRAWTSFLVFFALAMISILIPVAHFLLVPGFLIAAFASLFMKLAATSQVHEARGSCPDCAAEQEFDLSGAWRLPRDVTCRGCQRRLTLTAAPVPEG